MYSIAVGGLVVEPREKHRAVRDIFLSLGGASGAADADGIEHHVSGETLTAFRKYLAKSQRKR